MHEKDFLIHTFFKNFQRNFFYGWNDFDQIQVKNNPCGSQQLTLTVSIKKYLLEFYLFSMVAIFNY